MRLKRCKDYVYTFRFIFTVHHCFECITFLIGPLLSEEAYFLFLITIILNNAKVGWVLFVALIVLLLKLILLSLSLLFLLGAIMVKKKISELSYGSICLPPVRIQKSSRLSSIFQSRKYKKLCATHIPSIDSSTR